MSARLDLVATTPPSCDIPRVIRLRLGDSLTFGRARSSDVVLDSVLDAARGMISRSHAKLSWDAASRQLSLFDLHSTNGVYVNDRKIGDVQQLRSGDRITFGGRGKSVPVGQVDRQPNSEFVYLLTVEDDAAGEGDAAEEEAPSTFELLKALTDNVQLLLTWITAALLVGSYLFAEEGSAEHSYVVEYVAPVFALVGCPFTRTTFTVAFVAAVGSLLAVAIALLRSSHAQPADKGRARKKAE